MLVRILSALLPALLFSACGPVAEEQSAHTAADERWEKLTSGWNEVRPGGSTLCSNGTPYAFYFYPQQRDKLMVFFQGGGACWNPANCDLADKPTYDPMVDSTDNPGVSTSQQYGWAGIFDFSNPDNPFRDYSVLVIPYCTADTHLGNQDVAYEKGDSSVMIHHRGYTNSMAALQWVYARIPQPGIVFVAGASAGSIASPVYAGIMADHYTEARVINLGDCSGAYRGDEIKEIMSRWGTVPVLEAAGVKAPAQVADFTEVIVEVGKQHSNLTFAQYNSAYDEVQQFFLGQLGESADSVHTYLRGNMEYLARSLPNYRYYIDTGRHHVILQRPEFYTTGVNDTRLLDWVTQLARGGMVASVYCEPCGR